MTHFDQEHTTWKLPREVQDDGIAVRETGVDRTGHGGRGVDDHQVARPEELAERIETRVHRRGVAVAHEQPHPVTTVAGGFGRLVRFVLGVEHEAECWYRYARGLCRLDHGYLVPAATKALAS